MGDSWLGAVVDGIRDAATLEKYGEGCPDDWIERRLYKRHDTLGLLLLWAGDTGWLCIRALAGLGLARDIYWFGRRWDGATQPQEQNE